MEEYCNDWECPHNKDGVCAANAEESAQCLNDLLEALSRLKKLQEKNAKKG